MVLFFVVLCFLVDGGLLVVVYWKVYLLVMGFVFVMMVLVIIVVEKWGKMKLVLFGGILVILIG